MSTKVSHRSVYAVVKRLLDLVAASFMLVVLFPHFVVVALAIKLSSRGPVIISQQRIGRDGKLFKLFKLRTMVQDAEFRAPTERLHDPSDGIRLKMRSDPRITLVGRELRRFSLDELPALLNVVRGEMSLVGPRPSIPFEAALFSGEQLRRFDVRPVITGLAAVSGRRDISFDEITALDLYYAEHQSLIWDIKILLRTITVVFRGHSVY